MKKLITLLFASLLSFSASAQVLEAKPFAGLFDEIQKAEFKYVGRGLIFGFVSIQSCLYVSEEIAIIKNYCYPARPYIARGHTIISAKYGMVELYEEKVGELFDRTITLVQFPEIMAPYMTRAIPDYTIASVSDMIEKMYENYYPGCWSTNMDMETGEPVANCTVPLERVQGYEAWAAGTQALVVDRPLWMEMMKAMELKTSGN